VIYYAFVHEVKRINLEVGDFMLRLGCMQVINADDREDLRLRLV